MKPLPVLLALSLVANAALYLTLPSSEAGGNPASAAAVSAATAVKPVVVPHAAFWEKLRSGDASALEQLRAAGWPETAIKALVEAQVDELYRTREKALQPDPHAYPYWSDAALRKRWGPTDRKAARELAMEKRAMLKKLLGADYISEANYWGDMRFADLPPAKAEELRLLDEDYQAMSAEISGNNYFQRVLLPEEREKLAFLEKEKRADLAKMLSPAELADYDQKYSQTASSLRHSLSAFEPTEEEFRAIFALQQPLDDKVGHRSGPSTRAQSELMRQNKAELEAKLKTQLSAARYAEYQRAQDYDYRRLYALSERMNIPKENAVAAYQLSQDVKTQLNKLPRAKTPEEIAMYNTRVAALRQDTETRLIAALGQAGFEAYKTNGGNDLLNRLAPRLTPPPTTP